MKVSELSGAQLDEWVARAEGHAVDRRFRAEANSFVQVIVSEHGSRGVPHYSSDWAQGGPIIERERFEIAPWLDQDGHLHWLAQQQELRDLFNKHALSGATALVAAMRAYVALKFGADVPDEVPA
ncbi:DUF2591 domain-containing protein [Paraburkholderia sp. Ac-20340]|uniref:phage protein NinX family protein n=1 Tax=Paraburkholderia sp. Ac-20340 TaxID=2703888 RepID=UPI00197EAFE5|nr:phage protein NinX family protein [Paraburkholderia sp. Ac-20340]MBN3851988.1 DUF2591 domain-containing protein [Paraburkholderia sp. Ac-20340]